MMQTIIQTGRQAALAAGEIMRRNYLKPHHVTLKSAIDPVTETDLACQQTIITLIQQTFPEHGFLAEERIREDVGEGARGHRPLPP
ncbi:MAG: inositol monophosphatase family protein, partial [Thermodesulfobacteriota bacterium]